MKPFMKRAGEFWVPDAEEMALAQIAKGGAQAHHIPVALKYTAQRRTAVDVGANVGTWTRPLLALFRTVIAFEPAPDTFECLDRNCPEAVLHQSGLSNFHGFATVMADDRYPDGTGSRWLKPSNDGVPLITLDSLNLSEVDLMKVDVEGMELRVFMGAVETLKRCKPVLVVEDKPKLRPRHDLEAPWKLLESLGYALKDTVGADRIYG